MPELQYRWQAQLVLLLVLVLWYLSYVPRLHNSCVIFMFDSTEGQGPALIG